MLPRTWITIQERRLGQRLKFTYKAVSHATLDAEIGLATSVVTVMSAAPAQAVTDLTEIAVLGFVPLDVCKVATRPRISVASLIGRRPV